jgi:antibiotic biosynthesis monooxygenase (ABM) superfamily enzyme
MSDQHLDTPSNAPRLLASVVTTLGAWLVAFAVVTALLTLFRHELGALPLAVRALVISGVLVALMVNLVMPVLSMAVTRWLADPPRTRLRRARPRAGSERERSERPQGF